MSIDNSTVCTISTQQRRLFLIEIYCNGLLSISSLHLYTSSLFSRLDYHLVQTTFPLWCSKISTWTEIISSLFTVSLPVVPFLHSNDYLVHHFSVYLTTRRAFFTLKWLISPPFFSLFSTCRAFFTLKWLIIPPFFSLFSTRRAFFPLNWLTIPFFFSSNF